MVVMKTMEAANEREFVVSCRQPGQQLGEANAGDFGRDRVKGSAELGRRGGFGIE